MGKPILLLLYLLNIPEFIQVEDDLFKMSKTEITVAQYRAYCNATKHLILDCKM